MFECQIHFAKVPCQVSGLLSFSSVEFRCPKTSPIILIGRAIWHSIFFAKSSNYCLIQDLGEKFGPGRSKVCWEKSWLIQQCMNCLIFFHRFFVTFLTFFLSFFLDSNCQNFWDVYYNCNTWPLTSMPCPLFSHPLEMYVCMLVWYAV